MWLQLNVRQNGAFVNTEEFFGVKGQIQPALC